MTIILLRNELCSTIQTSNSTKKNTGIPTSRVFILESTARSMNTSHQPSYAITCRRVPYIGLSHFVILRWVLYNLLCALVTYSYCLNCHRLSAIPYNSLRKDVKALDVQLQNSPYLPFKLIFTTTNSLASTKTHVHSPPQSKVTPCCFSHT